MTTDKKLEARNISRDDKAMARQYLRGNQDPLLDYLRYLAGELWYETHMELKTDVIEMNVGWLMGVHAPDSMQPILDCLQECRAHYEDTLAEYDLQVSEREYQETLDSMPNGMFL